MNEEQWIKHLKKLAKDNADLRVLVRSLRLEVTALKDEVDHYKIEFARQNARIITMAIQLAAKENDEKELARIRYFMSKRIDFDKESTVLEYYESLNKDSIDQMMADNA